MPGRTHRNSCISLESQNRTEVLLLDPPSPFPHALFGCNLGPGIADTPYPQAWPFFMCRASSLFKARQRAASACAKDNQCKRSKIQSGKRPTSITKQRQQCIAETDHHCTDHLAWSRRGGRIGAARNPFQRREQQANRH